MSTLTLSIIALVGVVVGLVVLYNVWQASRARRARERARRLTKGYFDPAPEDAPLGRRRDGPVAPAKASRWRAVPIDDGAGRDRREPTLDGELAMAAVTGVTRAAMDRLGGRDADAAGRDAPHPLHALTPDDDHRFGDAHDDAHDDEPRFVARYDDRGGHHVDDGAEPAGFAADAPDRFAADAPAGLRGAGAGPRSSPRTMPAPMHAGATAAAIRVADDGGELLVDEPAGGEDAGQPDSRLQDSRPQDSRWQDIGSPDTGPGDRGPDGEGDGEDAADVAAAAAAAAGDAEPPQADVEHCVVLQLATPVNAERLIALTSSFRHVGGKAVRIEVDQGGGQWVSLKSGGQVRALKLSILLANRQGPLNPVELSDFSATVESLATQIQAVYRAPDMAPVLRDARDLDALAARLDTQLDLSVECPEPVTPRGLATLARQLDLHDRGGGRHAAFADDGDLLYTMAAGESADLIVFVLDVPRTARRHEAWRLMIAAASACAQTVHGRLVDSSGRGLSVGMIQRIERQLEERYRELAKAGLPAGSPAALRVFG